MSEAAPEQAAPPADAVEPKEQPQEGAPKEPEAKVFDAEYVEKIRKEAAQHRTEKNALAKELEQFRKASMTETERAIAEAEQRGAMSARTELGRELATAQFEAAATRKNPQLDAEQLAKKIRRLDLSGLLDEDGRPDPKAVQEAVDDLIDAPSNTPPSLDLGQRGAPSQTKDFNQALRAAVGRA